MPNLDHERMIKLGEWLQKFLSPDTKSWGYRDLAKDFIDLYDMAFELSHNDITIQALALIKDSDPEIGKNYIGYLEGIDRFLELNIPFLLDSPNDKTEKFNILYQNANDEGKKILTLIHDNIIIEDPFEEKNFDAEIFLINDFIEYSLKKIAKIIEISSLIKTTFQLLSENSTPWIYSLSTIFQNDKYLTYNHNKRSSLNGLMVKLSNHNPSTLLNGYKGVVEEIIINEHRVEKQKTFQTIYKDSLSTREHPSVFPWEVAASRIFFDFLFLGGQEYFLFCEYCGKFTVIQRKGRKKFCSDICRTAHRNDNLTKL